MIAWLEGVLRDKQPTRLVVDVTGVGYELSIPLSTFDALPDAGKTIALHVHTIVRQDSIQLFGFATTRERATFEMLLKANKVGPKLAQTILSGIEPERLLRALRDGDVKVLKGAPGVGPKLAERMSFELRDRAMELLGAGVAGDMAGAAAGGGAESAPEQLLSALQNLGWKTAQAEQVVDSTVAEAGEDAGVETLIRIALRRLAR